MKKFIIKLSGGDYDDYYQYNVSVIANSKDEIEFKLLKLLEISKCSFGIISEDMIFQDYEIYTLDEWFNNSIIKL